MTSNNPLQEKSNEQELKKARSMFLSKEGETRIWTLSYVKGGSKVLDKMFPFDGDMQGAILRGRKHCELLGLRFVIVRPAIVDLDYQENMFLQGKYKDPDARET